MEGTSLLEGWSRPRPWTLVREEAAGAETGTQHRSIAEARLYAEAHPALHLTTHLSLGLVALALGNGSTILAWELGNLPWVLLGVALATVHLLPVWFPAFLVASHYTRLDRPPSSNAGQRDSPAPAKGSEGTACPPHVRQALERAHYIYLQPTPHNGAAELVRLGRNPSTGLPTFHHQKIKYEWNPKLGSFLPIRYPVAKPLAHYQALVGRRVDVKRMFSIYGRNRFEIPMPTFLALFKQHMVAPFFVFQLFCVALWFLDDMWYYSLFTLFMLFVFEATVVFQRLKSLQEFRSMSIQPYPVWVLRNPDTWASIKSDTLLPGDIVSITHRQDESPVAADVLLLAGQCIANEAMLSGESTPQLKESVHSRPGGEVFSFAYGKGMVVFGGTKVLQITPAPPGTSTLPAPPDGGCPALVLRTGFNTEQGQLVRMIIYATERVTANNTESLLFICFLLVFAILAAAYVWTEGVADESRERSKILLDCILIITSVVPPELPMELSMAVNHSILSLSKLYIYCTEPFRIPFAGKVDVACFDKTGTLTEENLLVEGVLQVPAAGASGSAGTEGSAVITPAADVSASTLRVLACAHALVRLEDGGIIGDPMEKNTLDAIGWTIDRRGHVHPDPRNDNPVSPTLVAQGHTILKRFFFSSALKRMSTISTLGAGKFLVAVKGAPETIKGMLATVPPDYDAIYKQYARRGKRVLALAYKVALSPHLEREEAEAGLTFAGYLVFGCPLKPDAKRAIAQLTNSSHRVIMITGDNALTACYVAQELGMTRRPVLVADVEEGTGTLAWTSIDETIVLPHSPTRLDPRLLASYDLCTTGKGLEVLRQCPYFTTHLLPRLWVYARVFPSQKEFVLSSLKVAGFTTLMCGDGTNDVGALKQAHVGIALLDGKQEDLERLAAKQLQRRREALLAQQEKMRAQFGLPPTPGSAVPVAKTGALAVAAAAATAAPKSKAEQRAAQLKELESKLTASLGAAGMEDDIPVIKFGDASVAAPFTSKTSAVMSVVHIVRQGRATLIAMVQMYKILALNCLISAYSMSVMYLAGIKQGDWQATVGGILITACFFGIAKASPIETLSKKRPQANVFNFYVIISVLGQTAVHIAALMYIREQSMLYEDAFADEDAEPMELDAPFAPNLLNSAVYLVGLIMQISTFAINYQGLPFRESIFKNRTLFYSLVTVAGIAVLAALEVSQELNDTMQLVPFPGDFSLKLLSCMALDFAGALVVESVCNAVFSDNRAKAVLFPY